MKGSSAPRFLTLHPQGKAGVNILLDKYETIKACILHALQAQELTATGLFEAVAMQLGDGFEGSITWYVETVKLDLEARGIIARVQVKRVTLYRIV